MTLLAGAARHGRLLLIAGLLAGILLPGVAAVLRPWLPEMVAMLLFLAALRIGPGGLWLALGAARSTLVVTLAYQLALPLIVAGALAAAGLASTPAGLAAILVATGASVAGSPNLSILSGGAPEPALRLLILGTMLLPLTVLPVFAIAGLDPAGIAQAALRLTGIIGAAGLVALLLHRPLMRGPGATAHVDGLSAIMMSIIVVALMTAVAPTLRGAPLSFAAWLAFACAVNFGLQIAAALVLRRTSLAAQTIPLSIAAGNRNIALFLVALPEATTAPLLIFIGCYQIPMFLTPLVMGRLYRRGTGETEGV